MIIIIGELTAASQHGGCSSVRAPIDLKLGSVGFSGGRKTAEPAGKK